MPIRFRDLLASSLAVLVATVSLPAVVTAAATTGPAPTADDGSKPPSWWLKTGETRQVKGDNAGAGKAYARAFDGLSEAKRRANVGARTAMLAADAYWMAFEADDNVVHLAAAIEVLDRWIQFTGPGSRASLLSTVERTAARLAAIQQPRKEIDAALEQGDLDRATRSQPKLLEALSVQRRPWPVGARLVLRVGRAHVEAYDRAVGDEDSQIEAQKPKLLTAKQSLEGWRAQRPDDDDSTEGPAVDALLAEIQARLDEGDQRLAAAAKAEQERAAAEQAAREAEQQRLAEQAAAEQAQARAEAASKRRNAAIILLATGVTATAAGAGLLGEGLAFRAESQRLLQAEQDRADELTQMFGDDFARDDFDASVADYDDQVRRRNTAFIISGSVLAAGGLAASAVGIVWLVRGRGAKGARPTEQTPTKQARTNQSRPKQPRTKPAPTVQAWLTPSVSPSQVRLSLTARF
ncbi:MAG: hypothetical protein AAGF11_13620 [Myxococcota bacterium]